MTTRRELLRSGLSGAGLMLGAAALLSGCSDESDKGAGQAKVSAERQAELDKQAAASAAAAKEQKKGGGGGGETPAK